MPGHKEISRSIKALETALTAKDPFKELFKMAADFTRKNEIDGLVNIDVMLSDRFIEYLRNGTVNDLDAFQSNILSFTDSEIGDRLKENEEGKKYFHRWYHFLDLCRMAVENYDPALTKRFIESRKYGKELMNLLDKNPNGIRHIELSKKLGISPQYLSKLLREFQEHNLISRARKKKVSIIKLGLTGRAYMRENENHLPSEKDKYYLTPEPTAIVAENVEPYMSIPEGREKVPREKVPGKKK